MLGWARRLNFPPMCPLMCWLLSCGLCGFAVLADRWQAILGEFPGKCTQCPCSAHTVQQLGLDHKAEGCGVASILQSSPIAPRGSNELLPSRERATMYNCLGNCFLLMPVGLGFFPTACLYVHVLIVGALVWHMICSCLDLIVHAHCLSVYFFFGAMHFFRPLKSSSKTGLIKRMAEAYPEVEEYQEYLPNVESELRMLALEYLGSKLDANYCIALPEAQELLLRLDAISKYVQVEQMPATLKEIQFSSCVQV